MDETNGIDPITYNKLNNFEQQLAQFFPETFAFMMLGKVKEHGGGGEMHLNTLIDILLKLNAEATTGKVLITYNKGHINSINLATDLISKDSRAVPYQ